MFSMLTRQELRGRMDRFRAAMDSKNPDWDTAIILGKINQYYFTGTMQDAVLLIRKGGNAYYFVRRSYERAVGESAFEAIYRIGSYRDAADIAGAACGITYIETETATVGIVQRLKKYLNMDRLCSLDKAVLSVREVKSPYELYWMEKAGEKHNELFTNTVPALLREGISEADFAAELFEKMMKSGHHGACRFSIFQTEMGIGQIGFGESSLYPTYFDGPGGAFGMCPAVPLYGSRERKLKYGDLVFVDVGFGMNGYHTDKTQVYMFGGKPSLEIHMAHRGCIEVENRLAALMKPGALPSQIYNTVMNELDNNFKNDFMGFGDRTVKFLGHGIGLHIDETPVIANGFDDPLQENMTIALEPKKGMVNVGVVGVEDTYIVTPNGARCITGGGRDIITV